MVFDFRATTLMKYIVSQCIHDSQGCRIPPQRAFDSGTPHVVRKFAFFVDIPDLREKLPLSRNTRGD